MIILIYNIINFLWNNLNFIRLFIGEQIAINVDGSGRKPNLDDEMTYGRGFMDRITLSSSKSVKVCSNAN